MKIEVWADFVSPQCYVFHHLLSQVLLSFPYANEVVIEYRSMPSLLSVLDEDQRMNSFAIGDVPNGKQIEKIAKSIGLSLPAKVKMVHDTTNAHRLLKYAMMMKCQPALFSSLMDASIMEGIDLTSLSELTAFADQHGFDKIAVEELLTGSQFIDQLQIDIEQAMAMDVTDLPFIVFNSKYALAGLPSRVALKEAIRDVWDEEHPDRMWRSRQGMVCTSEGCFPSDDK